MKARAEQPAAHMTQEAPEKPSVNTPKGKKEAARDKQTAARDKAGSSSK